MGSPGSPVPWVPQHKRSVWGQMRNRGAGCCVPFYPPPAPKFVHKSKCSWRLLGILHCPSWDASVGTQGRTTPNWDPILRPWPQAPVRSHVFRQPWAPTDGPRSHGCLPRMSWRRRVPLIPELPCGASQPARAPAPSLCM